MPQEVFDQWIAPAIPDYGWPFDSLDSPIQTTKWGNFFAKYSLRQWAGFKWKLMRVQFEPGIFERGTFWRMKEIIQHCAFGIQSATSNIENSRERFLKCVDYIKQHQKIPLPVIATIDPLEGIDIVDGHHRMAAALYLNVPRNFWFQIWLATDGAKPEALSKI